MTHDLEPLTEPFVGSLPLEAAVAPSVVVEPFPLLKQVVELRDRGNDHALEKAIGEGGLTLAVEVDTPRRR